MFGRLFPASTRRTYRPQLENLEQRDVPTGQLVNHFHVLPIDGLIGNNGITLTQTGQTILAGTSFAENNFGDLLITRLSTTGTADPTFGVGGTADIPLTALPQDFSFGYGVGGVAVNAWNGDVIVAGLAIDPNSFTPEVFVLGLTNQGTLDPTFGNPATPGVTIFGTGMVGFSGLALSSWGAIYVAAADGSQSITVANLTPTPDNPTTTYGYNRLDIARLTPSGQLDSTFAAGDPGAMTGVATVVLPGTMIDPNTGIIPPNTFISGTNNGLAVNLFGQPVVAGTVVDQMTFTSNFAVVRLTPSGQPDPTFGSAGTAVFGDGNDSASGVALNALGQTVVAGTSGSTFAVARLNANGSLDQTFGGGFITLALPSGVDSVTQVSVGLEPTGRIDLIGNIPGSFSFVGYTMVELNADGSLYNGLGPGGMEVVTASDLGYDLAAAAGFVVLPTGRIVVAIEVADLSTFTEDYLAVEYQF
jgi:uncharacterized delta-60 repeat protein